MIKQITFENWKSFGQAKLNIDPLTVLIGTNASGKSNAVDGLEFLRRIALGKDLQSALNGDSTLPPIRGGVAWAALKANNQLTIPSSKPNTRFTLKVIIQGEDDQTDYGYSVTIETELPVRLFAERFTRIKYHQNNTEGYDELDLFTHYISMQNPEIRLRGISPSSLGDYYRRVNDSAPILPYLKGLSTKSTDLVSVDYVADALEQIFILDPVPSQMRAPSALSERLENNAANIAGVLAALSRKDMKRFEDKLKIYVTHLPERDIHRVWAEPLSQLKDLAFLFSEEEWTPGNLTTVDARSMSDGTLRFLAILTALLTRPEGSLLVVEDVDNGLHPSRIGLLLRMLQEVGRERKIDVLVTTHNPALLDALDPGLYPFVMVAHRDPKTGESKLTSVEDVQNLPKLLASGPLGDIATRGSLERSLSRTR